MRYRLAQELSWRRICDDEVILLPSVTSTTLELETLLSTNDVGFEICRILKESGPDGVAVSDFVTTIKDNFDMTGVDSSRIEEDVTSFLHQLRDNGLVVES